MPSTSRLGSQYPTSAGIAGCATATPIPITTVGPLYFGTNAFLPGYLSEAGKADLISPASTALNLGQLPASFLLIAFSRRLESRAWPFILSSLIGLAGIGAIVVTASAWTVVSAGVVGFACGAAFALGLTLPPLLSKPEKSHTWQRPCSPSVMGRPSWLC